MTAAKKKPPQESKKRSKIRTLFVASAILSSSCATNQRVPGIQKVVSDVVLTIGVGVPPLILIGMFQDCLAKNGIAETSLSDGTIHGNFQSVITTSDGKTQLTTFEVHLDSENVKPSLAKSCLAKAKREFTNLLASNPYPDAAQKPATGNVSLAPLITATGTLFPVRNVTIEAGQSRLEIPKVEYSSAKIEDSSNKLTMETMDMTLYMKISDPNTPGKYYDTGSGSIKIPISFKPGP